MRGEYDEQGGFAAERVQAAAGVRAEQVAAWVRERKAQARGAAESSLGELAAAADAGEVPAIVRLAAALQTLQKSSGAACVMVTDADGGVVASAGARPQVARDLGLALPSVLKGNSPALLEPASAEFASERVDFAAPLAAEARGPRFALVLRFDPRQALLPMIREWPLPGAHGATVLFRADGQPIVQSHMADSRPGEASAALARAVAQTGAAAMDESRSHAAFAQPIEGTRWMLASEISMESFYEDAWHAASLSAIFALGALLTLALGAYMLMQRHRLQLQRALGREQAQRLEVLALIQSFTDNSGDPMYATDLQGRYMMFNRAAAQCLGIAQQDVIGRLDTEVLRPDDAARMRNSDQRVIISGEPIRYEHEIETGQGRRIFETSKAPLRGPDGNVAGVFAILHDTTAARRAQRELRDAAATVQAVGDSVLDHIAVLDAEGVVTRANAAWHAFLKEGRSAGCGAMPRCAVGSNYVGSLACAPGAEAVRAWAGVLAVLRGRVGAFTMEYACDVGDDTRWFMLNVTPLKAEGGGAVAVHTDITRLKRSEAELARYRAGLEDQVRERTAMLEESNERLADRERFVRTMTNNVPALIAYWDAGMRCRFSNRSYARRFGKEPYEAVGLHASELMGAEMYESVRPVSEQALRGERVDYPKTLELDGSNVDVWVSLIPDRVDGDVQGFFVLAIEVTELRRAEVALQRANEALLAQRDRAQAASRAKSAFLANMSHEMRTPMNAILGFTDLMRGEVADGACDPRLDNIAQAGNYLLQLINDVLDLSKIESGKLTLAHEPFSLGELVAQTRMLVAEAAQAKGLVLECDTDGAPPALVGDATRLSQALLNLLGNAVKFTEHGSVRLRVTTVAEHASGPELRFEVRDTGIGIAEDVQPRLFTAFEQADVSTTRRFGGSGLGLALTRRLAELMGGSAGVASREGVGSTFWFSARLERCDEASLARRAAGAIASMPAARAEDAPPVQAGSRILVVEDNRFNQEVAVAVLQRLGLQPDLAADGEQALARARECRYGLVLMDLHMPVMDGFEAARRMRGIEGYETVPILALTADAFGETRAACLEAGMNDHIAKPVSTKRLRDAIGRWLPAAATPVPQPDAALPARLVDRLAGIDGFDALQGLELVDGDEAAYLRLLRSFVGHQADGLPQLDAALAARRLAQARLMVHSFKGAAAAVGAHVVRRLALSLERAILESAPVERLRLAAFDLQYEIVHLVAALHDRLPPCESMAEEAGGQSDEAQLAREAESLELLLASGDWSAERQWRDVAGVFRAAWGGAADEIGAALREHDHERALAVLRRLSGPVAEASL
ncbi:MAG TPA: PAS domain-containing protein [Ramlibacter sp.]|uniref:PAS domain-containing protein n=1 Tax=Ramlibacter sp. TaxID=1917967 RepID=UPI002B8A6F13|nr:PAS domain-containing protein [Ramlibacter sp.]HVZ42811.1 PAS domain-containing protein [Ramlibacter sp.]